MINKQIISFYIICRRVRVSVRMRGAVRAFINDEKGTTSTGSANPFKIPKYGPP
jgi:hypothetical protein